MWLWIIKVDHTTKKQQNGGSGFSRVHTQETPTNVQKRIDEEAIKIAKKVDEEVKQITQIARTAYHEDPGQFHDGEVSWTEI